MVGRLGIGNGIGIPFRNRVSGGGVVLPPELKEALVGVWIADQNNNESSTRNIIKNKIPNKGGDFEILNAAYDSNSGYGIIATNFLNYGKDWGEFKGIELTQTSFIVNNNNRHSLLFIYGSPNAIDIEGYEVDIVISKTDNAKKSISYYYFDEQGNRTALIINKSGRFTVPKNYISKGTVWAGWLVEANVTCSITQIPDYQGSFVTDGVDDLIISQKSVSDMLGGSNEITVVSMVANLGIKVSRVNVIRGGGYIQNYYSNSKGVKDKTYIIGYNSSDLSSYNIVNTLLGDKNDYQLQINGNINNPKYSVQGYLNANVNIPYETSEVAWYWTIIANKVLTTDEINQVIAYYNLDKYVAPDIYYDVKKQGITNDNHAEFGDKLIDYSGNSKDMQLYNFGWEGMSGVNGYPVVFGANKTWANTPSDYITDYTNNKAHITRVKKANNGLFFSYVKNNGVLMNIKETPSFKIKVSGLGGNSKLWYRYLKTENATAGTILLLDNGIHEIPKSFTPTDTLVGNVWIGFSISPISDGVIFFDCDITIEILPEYKSALVTDGVEDYGQYVGDLRLKDYTVIADRAYVELMQNQVPIISNITAATLTPFIFEYTTTIANTVNPFSFGGRNTINKPIDQNKLISYQSTYVYNGDSISKLGGTDITCTGLTFGRYGGNSQYAKLCLYSFMLFPYSLSKFLIERQLKKRKLGTLHPDMVELRPIVKINDDAFRVAYCKEGGENIYPGDYVPIGSKVLILINEKDSSIDYEIRQVLVNGKETELMETMGGEAYMFVITKSPQKINVTIDSYTLYENMDFPYPFIPNLYWDKELKNRITWGDKVKVGSTIYGHLDTNLLPELYTHNRIIYKGQTVNMLPIIVEDYMYFGVVSKRYLKENEPKCILSPERLRLPNEVYKRIGCIPDISGHYNHGFFYNLAYTEESGATADGAIKLDGVNDYISIYNLGRGGKQVLMKVNWTRNSGILYDQRIDTVQPWLFGIYCDANDSSIAYNSRNTNGQTYLDGVLNQQINASDLINIKHNITITNIDVVDSKTKTPIIGSNYSHDGAFAPMSLYAFMLFDEISTEEEIKELNEIVGIEGNTNDLFNPTN